VLVLEAGMDTPDGRVPDALLDSRSIVAIRDPRFTWTDLRVTTGGDAAQRSGRAAGRGSIATSRRG
jgi:hypothetical protein